MESNNTLTDLNTILFDQMKRFNNPELSEEDLKKEVTRGTAMTGVASKIIDNAALSLKATEFQYEKVSGLKSIPAQLRLKE